MATMATEALIGQIVHVQMSRDYARLGAYGRTTLTPRDQLRITKVNTHTIYVRCDRHGYSFSIPREHFTDLDPNAPAPRKLGTPPEEGEHIAADDPRIRWLFDDMAEMATREGYCSTYDSLCAKLGVPGRKRDFKVTHTVNDMTFTTSVKAYSQREANELVQAALGGKTEPDLAPAA